MNPHHCDHGVCPRCLYDRTRKPREKFDHLAGVPAEAGRKLRMLTLTQVVQEGAEWPQAKARLMKGLGRFWRDRETKAVVRGGLRRVETTWSVSSRGWHLPIHFVYDGAFWAQEDVARVWNRHVQNTTTLRRPQRIKRSTFLELLPEDRLLIPDGAAATDLGATLRLPPGTVWTPRAICDIREVTRSEELFKYLVKTSSGPAEKLVEYPLTLVASADARARMDGPEERGHARFQPGLQVSFKCCACPCSDRYQSLDSALPESVLWA